MMRFQTYKSWIEFILLVLVSAAIYLPFIGQFGYYYDDWYSMYAARVGGTQTFYEMYSIDRPGRAYIMIPLYMLFKGDPLYYNILAYILRLVGALLLLWVLRLIWQEQRFETFLVAFLFLIYPGFLSMPNAIDFQSHLVAVCLVFLSFGISIVAVSAQDLKIRVALWLGAALTGWAYLSQMEYYLGFETVRVFLLGVVAWREHLHWKQRIKRAFHTWLPYAPIPVLYLIWRLFFFNNERMQTDVGLQLSVLQAAPIATLYDWFGNYIQSVLNVVLLAWGVPLSQLSFTLDTSNKIRGIALALVIILISTLVISYLRRVNGKSKEDSTNWRKEMLGVGILWTIGGLIIVILANRSVVFPAYARYGLVSAPGGIMILVAGLSFLSEKRVQLVIISFLVFSGGFTHYANGTVFAQSAERMRFFWWQVSWRIPQLEQGTTLVVQYPSTITEARDVWGPANHIYYPVQLNPNKILLGVNAILLDHNAVIRILLRERQVYRKEIIVETYPNYRNILILTQPTLNSCVHVIDGKQPEYSRHENDAILVVGPYSEVEHISLQDEF